MNHSEELMLNAYLDNELDVRETDRFLSWIDSNPKFKIRLEELQANKQLLKSAFDDEVSKTEIPGLCARMQLPELGQVAASLVFGVVLGIVSTNLHNLGGNDKETLGATNIAQTEKPLVIHLDKNDQALLKRTVEMAESALLAGANEQKPVEILTNANGLDLLDANSPYASQLTHLMKKYPNLRLVACTNGIARKLERGETVNLLPGIVQERSAIEHVVDRLQSGWSYLRI